MSSMALTWCRKLVVQKTKHCGMGTRWNLRAKRPADTGELPVLSGVADLTYSRFSATHYLTCMWQGAFLVEASL